MNTLKSIASLICILALGFVLASCGKDAVKKDETEKSKTKDTVKTTVPNTEDMVLKISKYRIDGESKLNANKFTKKEINLNSDNVKGDLKQKWEKADAYFEGDNLIRIMLYPHKNVSNRTEEFYLKDGKIVFAYIQEGEKHEGHDAGERGKEFYFDNDKLIKYLNNTEEKSVNEQEEVKMYETSLPFEVKQVVEIVKSSK